MLTIDPTNPTTADIAWAIGMLVICVIGFYEFIKISGKSKRNKWNDEHDTYL